MTTTQKKTWKRMTSHPLTTERVVHLFCVEDDRECWRSVRWNSGRPSFYGPGYAEPECKTVTVSKWEF